jgi:uncharacterized protein YbjT (DUF2867 family)
MTGSSETKTVLVAGATGGQGGAVARTLLGRGHTVHALTRKPGSDAAAGLLEFGALPVRGDFDDPASLAAALAPGGRPVDALFAMSTPFDGGAEAEARQGRALVDAAARAGVGHVVYSSVASADRRTGVPHFDSKYAVEQHLAALGVPWTVLGPVQFLDGVAGGWTRGLVAAGKFVLPLDGARPLQVVALADLGRVAARVIERPAAFAGRRIDVAADELTPARMAQFLAAASGHPVRHDAADLAAFGVDAESASAKQMRWLSEVGYRADLAALRAEFPDIAWITFADWAARIDWTPPVPDAEFR